MGPPRSNVTILGGDPVIVRSLEALLRTAGYHARSLAEDQVDELGDALFASRVLVVAPGQGAGFREVILQALTGATATEIPVVELLPVDAEQMFEGAFVVAWPCPPEKFRRIVHTALHSRR